MPFVIVLLALAVGVLSGHFKVANQPNQASAQQICGGCGNCQPGDFQICTDDNCNTTTHFCSYCATVGGPCQGLLNQCTSGTFGANCALWNWEGVCQSDSSCSQLAQVVHQDCPRNTTCVEGGVGQSAQCVSSPGACGGCVSNCSSLICGQVDQCGNTCQSGSGCTQPNTCSPSNPTGTCPSGQTCCSGNCQTSCGGGGATCGGGSICSPNPTCSGGCTAIQGVNGPLCIDPNTGNTCAGCPTCNAGAVCGNGRCESGESCSTCPSDCGSCSPPPNNCTTTTSHNCSNFSNCSYHYPVRSRYGSFTPGGCYNKCDGSYCGPSTDVQVNCGQAIYQNIDGCGTCGTQELNTFCVGGTTCGQQPDGRNFCCADSACSSSCGPGTKTHYDPTRSCQGTTVACCTAGCGWTCQQPLNGLEQDQCGNTRSNLSCSPVFFQATGANVHSNSSISGISDAFIPAGTLFNQLADGFYGIVSAQSSISFSAAKTNSKLWQLQNYPNSTTPILVNPSFDHNYFWNLFGSEVSSTVNGNTITSGDLQSGGSGPAVIAVHPVSGNSVSIAGPINVVGGKLVVVFVNSSTDPTGTPVNLTVAPGGSIRVDNKSMVVWIVSGNVTMDSSISQADGYWLSTGTFNDGSGGVQLTISGGIASYGGITLGRRNANQNLPSEIISYNPNILLLSPVLGTSNYSWMEISP